MNHFSDTCQSVMTGEMRALAANFTAEFEAEFELCCYCYAEAYRVANIDLPATTPEGTPVTQQARIASYKIQDYWKMRLRALVFHAGYNSDLIIDQIVNHPDEDVKRLYTSQAIYSIV